MVVVPDAIAQSGGGNGASVATKENLDLPFDAVGNSDDEEEAPEIIVFYGQQVEGDCFVFCCDKSSSMEGAQWKRLQQEVVKIINGFSDRVQFGIVFFDANMVKFPPSGRPADANQAMKGAGVAMVMSTVTGHGTCSKAALVQSLQYTNQSTGKRKSIVYLSDGHNTCNGMDEIEYTKSLMAEVTARNTQRAHINTFCIGSDWVDENFMRNLAAANQGTYTRIVTQ
jgi:hypothetical protein